jgi:hypothetical protein
MMRGLNLLLITIMFFSGCTSVVETAGRALDGSAFAEKKIALYQSLEKEKKKPIMEITVVENGNNEKSLIVTLKNYPMLKLRAAYPADDNSFHFTSLEYIGGNAHGWNEYTLALIGTGTLVFGETAAFSANADIEKVEITSGRIQRYDNRITGGEAVTALRNRRERIAATVDWMNSLEEIKGHTLKEFEKYWKPIFFPEMVMRSKRPADWGQEDDIFVRAEDIRWNTGYTERVFTEELVPVRNSGTMLRDWEEALAWIYMEYEWEKIIELLCKETVLTVK